MARNPIPTNSGQFIGMAVKMRQGLDNYGVALGITQLPPDGFQDDIDAYVAAEGAFGAARSARLAASEISQGRQGTLHEWLLTVRNVLAARFGNRWSPEWAQAGFANPTTQVPARMQDRMALALQLASFLTANPTYQVAPMDVTALYATNLYGELVAAQEGVMAAEVVLTAKETLRNSAYEALLGKMRWLIKILDGALTKADARWAAFGLNAPATSATPGQPQGLVAELSAAGMILAQCAATPLATRYRWRMRVVGVETAFRLATSSAEPIVQFAPQVLPGQMLEIMVQAANENLQGVPSAAVLVPIPLARAAAQGAPAGGGKAAGSNGHGNGVSPGAVAAGPRAGGR